MLHEMELLQYIYKTADMGCEGIDAVEKHAEERMLRELKREREEYQHIRAEADTLIRRHGDEPGGNSMMAKLSTEMMSATQMAMDDSRSKIAEMMIQGTTMGIVKTIRHLKDFRDGEGDARKLGERLLKTQENNVEKMKEYL